MTPSPADFHSYRSNCAVSAASLLITKQQEITPVCLYECTISKEAMSGVTPFGYLSPDIDSARYNRRQRSRTPCSSNKHNNLEMPTPTAVPTCGTTVHSSDQLWPHKAALPLPYGHLYGDTPKTTRRPTSVIFSRSMNLKDNHWHTSVIYARLRVWEICRLLTNQFLPIPLSLRLGFPCYMLQRSGVQRLLIFVHILFGTGMANCFCQKNSWIAQPSQWRGQPYMRLLIYPVEVS